MVVIEDIDLAERRTAFDGERLYATDLNDAHRHQQALRWLHNRSLHQAGVGSGYAVDGPKGSREVTVGPGYALDCLGRELILTRRLTLSVPPVAADLKDNCERPVHYYLAVRYPDDFTVVETRGAFCEARGAVRLSEEPVLEWVRLGISDDGKQFTARDETKGRDVEAGRLIVLAQIAVLQCRLAEDVAKTGLAVRRTARPARLPYVYSATVKPKWQFKPIDGTTGRSVPTADVNVKLMRLNSVLTATIDTSAANFVAIPQYTVRISGPRDFPWPTTQNPTPTPVLTLLPEIRAVLEPAGPKSPTDHRRLAVEVHVMVWADATGLDKLLQNSFYDDWSVSWSGVEG